MKGIKTVIFASLLVAPLAQASEASYYANAKQYAAGWLNWTKSTGSSVKAGVSEFGSKVWNKVPAMPSMPSMESAKTSVKEFGSKVYSMIPAMPSMDSVKALGNNAIALGNDVITYGKENPGTVVLVAMLTYVTARFGQAVYNSYQKNQKQS